MDLDSFLVSLYVLTDDWWKATHSSDTPGAGRPSLISEAEILTLAILAQWPRFRSERDFWRFAQAHLREYFPALPSQSQFNRRVRALEVEMRSLQFHLAGVLAEESAVYHVLDTTLIPAIVRVRACRKGLFCGQATFGRCVSKTEWVYGFKVGLSITPQGVITAFALAEASADERPIGDFLIRHDGHNAYLADKGFSSVHWERHSLASGVRGCGGGHSQGQLRESMAKGGSALGCGKTPDHRGGHKPAQGSVLPGAPQGEDPPRTSGAFGIEDHCLHLRTVLQLPTRSTVASFGRFVGLNSYASAVLG